MYEMSELVDAVYATKIVKICDKEYQVVNGVMATSDASFKLMLYVKSADGTLLQLTLETVNL